MELDAWMADQPPSDRPCLLSGVVEVEMNLVVAGNLGVDSFEEPPLRGNSWTRWRDAERAASRYLAWDQLQRVARAGDVVTTVVVAGPLPVPGMQAGSAEIARGLDLGPLVDREDGGPLGWSRYRPTAARTFSMTSGLDDQPIGRLRDALRSIGRDLEGPPHAADRGPWRWPSSKSICASDLCVVSVGLSSRVVTITASTRPSVDIC